MNRKIWHAVRYFYWILQVLKIRIGWISLECSMENFKVKKQKDLS